VRLAHAQHPGELRLGQAVAGTVPDHLDGHVVGELRALDLTAVAGVVVHVLLVDLGLGPQL
jgi:hypothetical protein